MASKEQVERQMRAINGALERAVVAFQRKNGGELPGRGRYRDAVRLNELSEKQLQQQQSWEEQRARLKLMQRFHSGSEVSNDGHGVCWRSPFEEIAEKEEQLALSSEDEARIFMEAIDWLIGFLFHEGPHPAHAMKRLYSWVKKFHPHLIWDLGFRNLAKLLGESHGAMQWRIEVLIDEYMRAKGLTGVRVPWQRGSDVREKCAENAKGNSNRIGGKRSAKHKSNRNEK